MISKLIVLAMESMHGRSLAHMVAAAGDDQVSDRTVRNWLSKRTFPSPERVESLLERSREVLLEDLATKEWPLRERQAYANGLTACEGIISGFVFTLQGSGGRYPACLELARNMDLLEQALATHRERDDVEAWVRTLFEAKWITDDHLLDPDLPDGVDAVRRKLQEARSWDALDHPASVLIFNLQFQLLATLDLEFCSDYLSDLKATPIFASLLPRMNPRVDMSTGTTVSVTRDMYHYPFRRLLDATACMRVMRQNPNRRWPVTVPAAEEMGVWLELAGEAELAGNLPKWRMGRSLTAQRYGDVWEACFKFLPAVEQPPIPIPMMYAATIFDELFVHGSRERRELTFLSLDPAVYLRWWDIQRRNVAARAAPPSFGSGNWTLALSR